MSIIVFHLLLLLLLLCVIFFCHAITPNVIIQIIHGTCKGYGLGEWFFDFIIAKGHLSTECNINHVKWPLLS